MEKEILLSFSHGDKLVFKHIFDTYYKSICLFIQKYIPDADQAQDIAQEVFIRLLSRGKRFPNALALQAYMYQTAKNLSLNTLKHEAVKKRYQETARLEPISENSFFQFYVEQEVSRLIMQTIDQLPPRQKSILRLSLEGRKNQDIAEGLNISIHTVKSHKVAAYKHLKDHLKDILLLLTIFLSC